MISESEKFVFILFISGMGKKIKGKLHKGSGGRAKRNTKTALTSEQGKNLKVDGGDDEKRECHATTLISA